MKKGLIIVLFLVACSSKPHVMAHDNSKVQTASPQPFISNPVAPPQETNESDMRLSEPEPTPTPEPLQKAYKSFETPFRPSGS